MSSWNLQKANNKFEAHKIITIQFEDNGPEIDFELKPLEQKRLVDRHILRESSDSGDMAVKFKDMAIMGRAVIKYVVGFRGFDGDINKDIIKQSCENFPSFAEMIAGLFMAEFNNYQSKAFEAQDEQEKN